MIDLSDSCFKRVKIKAEDEVSWQCVPNASSNGENEYIDTYIQECESICKL